MAGKKTSRAQTKSERKEMKQTEKKIGILPKTEMDRREIKRI